MSSTVRSYGFIAVLLNPVPKSDCDEFSERVYDDDSNLNITYNGELVYINYNQNLSLSDQENDVYGLRIGSPDKNHQDLIDEASKYGLNVDESTIQPFNCVWYNGGDCPVNLLTKAKYLKQING